MTLIYRLTLIAVPVLFRTIEQKMATRAGKPRGRVLGGTPSSALWFLCYVILLSLAVERLAGQSLTVWGWFGYAVLWCAIVLRSFALRALRGFYSERVAFRENHRVIADGVYKYLRHPLHLGLCFEMVGLSLMSGRWHSLVVLTAVFIALVFRNRNEEKLLKQRLGGAYAEYRRTAWDVIDLIPWLRK